MSAPEVLRAVPATRARYGFGEGLRFDDRTGSLLWVDLTAGRLHRPPLGALDDAELLCELDEPLGAVGPCTGGGWLLACGRGLSSLADDGTVTPLVRLEPAGNRMNDAACDPQGRLWLGTMALDEYNRKRDFAATPEPGGETRTRRKQDKSGALQYCIQKHDASRLHYDFRLELDGVLKSWAVPKGPSLDPAVNRLAMRTEDHPLDYGTFEGIIPAGEYGGGTVMLWDRGRWIPHPDKDPRKTIEEGHLHFTLEGERMRGEWVMFRMKGKPGEKATERAEERAEKLKAQQEAEAAAAAAPAPEPVAEEAPAAEEASATDEAAPAADDAATTEETAA